MREGGVCGVRERAIQGNYSHMTALVSKMMYVEFVALWSN